MPAFSPGTPGTGVTTVSEVVISPPASTAVAVTPVTPLTAQSFTPSTTTINPNTQLVTSSLPGTDVSGNIIPGTGGQSSTNTADTSDYRIRLRAQRGAEAQVYGAAGDSNILNLLNNTDGLLFPYTPTIAVSQEVDYRQIELVHTIGDILAYNRTPSVTLTVTGKFTVQNQREGQYALAVLHFLRTVSKMYFGEIDKTAGKAGIPPPVLVFRGYGNFMFNNLPVVLRSHSYNFDENMDMIQITTAGGMAMLPALFQVSLNLIVQQTPNAMRTVFSLDSFRTGQLLLSNSGTGWI